MATKNSALETMVDELAKKLMAADIAEAIKLLARTGRLGGEYTTAPAEEIRSDQLQARLPSARDIQRLTEELEKLNATVERIYQGVGILVNLKQNE